jgi:chromosome partitioning protein
MDAHVGVNPFQWEYGGMTVISIATTKGGVGKSTTVANIAVAAWSRGANIAVFDCDPQHHSQQMLGKYMEQMREHAPEKIEARKSLDVIVDIDQDNLLDRIREANERYQLVLVDLQGSANQMMLMSMMEADLVILPVQPSQLDIDGALVAWQQVAKASKLARREIASRIFFVRTPAAIQPKVLKQTRATFEANGIRVMKTEFVERSAFKELTFNGRFPSEFAPESPAAANVAGIYGELLEVLQEIMREAA